MKKDDLFYIENADRLGWKAKKITGTVTAKECGMALSIFRYRAAIYENARLL